MKVNRLLLAGALGLLTARPCFSADKTPLPSQVAYTQAVADVAKDKDLLATARDEAAKADSEMNKIHNQLKAEFEASAEWKTAQGNLKQAQVELDAAKAPVMQAVQNAPEYIAARNAKVKAEAHRDELAAKDDAKPEEKSAASQAVLDAGGTMSKLEGDALAMDGRTIKARQKLLEASNKVTSLTRDFEATEKASAGWTSAKKTQDDAHKKLSDAETAYTTAQKTQTTAYAAWQNEQKKLDKTKNTNKTASR